MVRLSVCPSFLLTFEIIILWFPCISFAGLALYTAIFLAALQFRAWIFNRSHSVGNDTLSPTPVAVATYFTSTRYKLCDMLLLFQLQNVNYLLKSRDFIVVRFHFRSTLLAFYSFDSRSLNFLELSYERNHAACVLLGLAYFSEYNVLQVHPCCYILGDFLLIKKSIIF